jgi:hypothetical protein
MSTLAMPVSVAPMVVLMIVEAASEPSAPPIDPACGL